MVSIVSLTGNFVTSKKKNFVSLFTGDRTQSKELDLIARDCNALQRQRGSFCFSRFVFSAVSLMGSAPLHQQSYHLENFREYYNSFDDGEDFSISK